jgi:hypothetical protein
LPGSGTCIPNGSGLVRSNYLINDGRQFFVEISYLLGGRASQRFARMIADLICPAAGNTRGTR